MWLRSKIQWLCVTILVSLTISSCLLFRKKKHSVNKAVGEFLAVSSSSSSSPFKYPKLVTKSMAELGPMDEMNKHFLFLNHVPKCGSEILILVLQKLQGYNNFRHVRLKGGNKRQLNRLQQANLIHEIYDTIREEAVPLSFDRHVYFLNFTDFNKQSPTYLNLIRDPVDKIMSRILSKNGKNDDIFFKCLLSKTNNCNYKNGKPYDLTIPYFCGQDHRCQNLNNEWAFNTAKLNVEKNYPVVAVLEELNVTLEILEYKIPYYFRGAQKIYQQNFLGKFKNFYKKKYNPVVPVKIRQKLKDTLVKEYEFYEWIKSRLFRQLQMLYGVHSYH